MSAAALAELIRNRQPCVVLTGAGMSTESGLPDFRSANGIWADVDPYEVATIDVFRRDPGRVWGWYGPRIRAVLEVEPNRGHHALVELERAGLVQAILTQNIDTLHTRAGSVDVVELHGSISRAICQACGTPEPLQGVLEQLAEAVTPICRSCGSVPKPDVVLFGEFLPERAFARAEALAGSAGTLLVVGSSLQVWPVAGLPASTLGAGGALAIINLERTAYDDRADVVVTASAADTLAAVAAILGVPE